MLTHHARVILTPDPMVYSVVDEASVEAVVTTSDTIGINEMRHASNEAHRRPREGFATKTVYVIGLKITGEAQQSALKLLEEPPADTSIVLVLPSGTQLIETVLSRVVIEQAESDSKNHAFSQWLASTTVDRIAEAEKQTKAANFQWLLSMKQGLQAYATTEHALPVATKRDMQLVLNNLLTRGASNKMLLEQLAFSLPTYSD